MQGSTGGSLGSRIDIANRGQIRFYRKGPAACSVKLTISYEVCPMWPLQQPSTCCITAHTSDTGLLSNMHRADLPYVEKGCCSLEDCRAGDTDVTLAALLCTGRGVPVPYINAVQWSSHNPASWEVQA